jgi:site-specific recombinase XerD
MQMYLNSFFKWAYRKKHIKEDIMLDVDSVKADAKKKEYLTQLEIDDLKDSAKKHKNIRDIALLEFLLSTGVRVGELVNLNIEDIDFDNSEVNIYAEKTREYRTGYLTARARKALKAYLGSRTDDNAALFVTTRKTNQRLQKGGVETILKNIAKEAGITKHCTVHLFRKTFATVLFANSCDITTIAKLLGHKSTETTSKHYLTIDKEDTKYRFTKAAA